MSDRYAEDVALVAKIDVVPSILDTVCQLTGMGFAAVARVTHDRWIACSVRDDIGFGLVPGGELKLETTICHEIRQSGRAVIISDVATDPDFRDHHTPAIYGIRSYISMPILLPNGEFFGTLCAIDPEPRDLGRREIRDTFAMFADLLGFHLQAFDRMNETEAELADQREISEVREQFIAVLGHDLRNPLAAIAAGVNILGRAPNPARAALVLEQMDSSVSRMAALIDNILDFARGRLGGGLPLERANVEMTPLVEQVVGELAAASPDREILLTSMADIPVQCDARRVGQLISNLVGNAITHGAPDQPIEVVCETSPTHLILKVTNGGVEIPVAARDNLFQPFQRGRIDQDREGLGLGLYIASQIAHAHGGDLTVDSSPSETRFTFRMPLEPGAD